MPRYPGAGTFPQPWRGHWTEWAQVHRPHQALPGTGGVAQLRPGRWYTVDPEAPPVEVTRPGPVAWSRATPP